MNESVLYNLVHARAFVSLFFLLFGCNTFRVVSLTLTCEISYSCSSLEALYLNFKRNVYTYVSNVYRWTIKFCRERMGKAFYDNHFLIIQ